MQSITAAASLSADAKNPRYQEIRSRIHQELLNRLIASGARIRRFELVSPSLHQIFLERVGADLRAKYIAFKTADDYPSSIDMATALHPQTLLALKYGGDTLADPFGYPMRLRTAVKLGYKNPKWITAIEVTNKYPGGYWESLGFPWFAGI